MGVMRDTTVSPLYNLLYQEEGKLLGSGSNVSDNSNLPSTVGQTFLSDRRTEQTGMSVLALCPE